MLFLTKNFAQCFIDKRGDQPYIGKLGWDLKLFPVDEYILKNKYFVLFALNLRE